MREIMICTAEHNYTKELAALFEEKGNYHVRTALPRQDLLYSIEQDAAGVPQVLLLEVGRERPFEAEHTFVICMNIKEKFPRCKILLMADGRDSVLTDIAIRCRKFDLCDEFVFADDGLIPSDGYLLALVDVLIYDLEMKDDESGNYPESEPKDNRKDGGDGMI